MRLCLSIVFFLALLLACATAAAQDDPNCTGAPAPQLVVGGQGRVGPGSPNNVRNQPAASGDKVGEIPAGGEFTVLDGPTCADGFNWWQVDFDGLTGWTVEGSGSDYWLVPVSTESDASPPAVNIAPYTQDDLNAFETIAMLACPQESTRTADGLDIHEDGRLIAFGCGSSDNAFGLYDIATRSLIDTYSGHQGFVRVLHFVPGTTQVLAVTDSEITLWNTQANEKVVNTGIDFIQDVVFTPNGDRFATANQSGSGASLWDTSTLTVVETLPDERLNIIDGLAISPDGTLLAAVGRNHAVRLWNLDTGDGWYASQADPAAVTYSLQRGIAFSPSGRFLVTSTCLEEEYDCTLVQIDWWDVATGTSVETWTYELSDENIAAFEFLPGGDYLLASGYYLYVIAIDIDTGEVVPNSIGLGGMQMKLSPDGSYLALNDGRTRLVGIPARIPEFSTTTTTTPAESLPADTTESITCDGFMPSRLTAGEGGRIIDGVNLNVRAEPSPGGAVIQQIPGGGAFAVLDGPVCADSGAWWQVEFTAEIGWAVEGSGETYWMEPLSAAELDSLSSGVLTRLSIASIDPLVTLGRGMVRNIHWSPDGNTVAVASTTGIWLYNADDFAQEPLHIRAQLGSAAPVAFSPDGKRIAAPECLVQDASFECPDPTVTTWDVATGEIVQRFQGEIDWVTGAAFSADGTELAFSSGSTVRFMNIANASIASVHSFEDNVRLLGTADSEYYGGAVIAVSIGRGYDQRVEVHSVATTTDDAQYQGLSAGYLSIVTTNLNGAFYVGFGEDAASTRSLSSDPYKVFSIPHNMPESAAYSPDGQLLAIGTGDGNILLWNTETQTEIARFDNVSPDWIRVIALHPDGTQAVFGSTQSWATIGDTANLTVIDLATGQELTQLTGYFPRVSGLVFIDGQIVASTTSHNSPEVTITAAWDASTFAPSPAEGASPASDKMIVTSSAHYIAREETVDVLDPTDGKVIRSLERFDAGIVSSIAIHENVVAVGYAMGAVSIFDATNGNIISENTAFPGEVITALTFSRDGALLAIGSNAGRFNIVDLAAGTSICQNTIENARVEDLLFTPDNSAMVIGLDGDNGEGGIALWDIMANAELGHFQVQLDGVMRLALSPDGTRLATGSADGTVVLWELPAD